MSHETFIKTPKQLITVVVLSFVIPIFLIVLLAQYVVGDKRASGAGEVVRPEAVTERIKPVAQLAYKDAKAPKVYQTGEAVYKSVCMTCHDAGLAGAPKMGDAGAWADRIKTGFDSLVGSVIKGKGTMAARGGNPDLEDFEIQRAVHFMMAKSGGNFPEPKEPAKAVVAGDAKAADAAPTSVPTTAPAVAAAAAPAAPAPAAAAPVFPETKVMFASGKSAIDEAGKKALAAAADFLKANANAKVNVSGYVDSTGNAAQNAELAKQRAFAVRDALKAAGVADTRIALKKPETVAAGASADARRVEVTLDGAAPVAATAAPAAAPAQLAAADNKAVGKGLYDQFCQVCHVSGAGGAPKLTDKAEWDKRAKTGVDALTASVIKGKGGMPPKGMAMAASDADLKAAVEYMLAQAK
jgi:cytochrome c5